MKHRLTALILTLILAAAILIGCSAAAAEREDTLNQITEMGHQPTEINTDTILTREAAEAIAFSNEGLTANQVTGLVTEFEIDDGVQEYEIDFRRGDYEYEFTVNAETGKITSRDKEYDPEISAVTEAPAEQVPATEPPATEAHAEKTPAKETTPKETTPKKESSGKPSSNKDTKLITADEAKAIALKHAGLSESKVTGLRAEYDVDDGVKEYDVDFRSGDYEYDYTIHAETGKIISYDKEYDPVETKPKETQPKETEPKPTEPAATEKPKDEIISADKAKSIALNHAGVSSADATGLRCEYEIDDGVKEYEVDFRSGDYEYDYTINAVTGKITSHDKEYDPVETRPAETEPPATEAHAEEKISANKAKSIALSHAGISAADAKGMECEYDVDDGRKTYEVSFRSGGYEYDYEIDAVTGKILSWDKEKDD